jgi:hypothetical protein
MALGHDARHGGAGVLHQHRPGMPACEIAWRSARRISSAVRTGITSGI